jgi:hypothetical protein
VCVWIDCSVQSALLTSDSNRRLVRHDVIRTRTVCWLQIGFLNLVVNGSPTAFDTKFSNTRTVFDIDNSARFSRMPDLVNCGGIRCRSTNK